MEQDNQDSDIKFEDTNFTASAQSGDNENSKLVKGVIKYSGGLIKNRRQANYLLITFCIVGIITSIVILIG